MDLGGWGRKELEETLIEVKKIFLSIGERQRNIKQVMRK